MANSGAWARSRSAWPRCSSSVASARTVMSKDMAQARLTAAPTGESQ